MRLIDEAEARRRIIAFATGLHSEVLLIDTVMMLLTQVTTIDAVPVVRCKDCKHWNWFGAESHRGLCVKVECLMYDDDFCSYGERKEGADNG